MIVFYNLETGKVTKYLSAPVSEAEMNLSEGEGFLESNVIPVENAYVNEGVVVTSGKPPSRFHVWDWPTKTWIPDLPAAITSRKNAIDQERDRRINSPLTYNGKNLDADARARENLKSKLEEIKSREALSLPMPTSMLVW